jgi:hypothetical protein
VDELDEPGQVVRVSGGKDPMAQVEDMTEVSVGYS